MKRNLFAPAMVSAFALLGACSGGAGGGGGISPAPAPAPAPSPTPTPTPTPTPVATNDDLVAPLVSESFTNDAATGTASFTSAGGTASVAPATLTVSYNAATSSYSVSVGARSQTFGPSNRDAGLSGGEADIYARTSGNTTDSLSITKSGLGPGTKVSPIYRYVAGGVWQRTVDNGTNVQGTGDAFTFGVQTPDSGLVRTGSATYAVQLRGLVAFNDGVLASRGTGNIAVNFGTGGMTGSGELRDYLTDGSPMGPRQWSLSATIGAATNSFTGGFGLSPPFGFTITGGGFVNGRFYGPAAQELGAVYGWRDGFLGTTYTGYILGKNASLFPENTTLANLIVQQTFPAYGYIYQYTTNVATGDVFGIGEPNPHPGRTVDVRFNETAGAIELNYLFVLPNRPLRASDRNAALSDARYDVYTITDPGPSNVPKTVTVYMFKPGPTNPELQLTYTSFGYWTSQTDDTSRSDYKDVTRAYFAYGLPTPASGVPTTGTASYSTSLYGKSTASAATAGGEIVQLDITGTGHLDLNFGTAGLTGYFRPVGRDTHGTVYGFTQTDFSGTLDSSGTFFAGATGTGSGNLEGRLYGPAGQEIGGRFLLDNNALTSPTNGFNAFKLYGVFVGRKDP